LRQAGRCGSRRSPANRAAQLIDVRKVRPQLNHYRQQAAMSAAEFGSVEKEAAHRVQKLSPLGRAPDGLLRGRTRLLPRVAAFAVCHARRARRQVAAVSNAAVCPKTNPSAQPQTPIARLPGATENHAAAAPSDCYPARPANDPG
jgi:hypothetical protein